MMNEVLVYGVGGSLILVSAMWLLCRYALKSPALRSTLWRVALLALWVLPAAVFVWNALPVEPVTISVPIVSPLDPMAMVSVEMPELPPSVAASPPWWAAIDPLKALPWLWAGGCLVGALLLMRDVVSARRALRRARESTDQAVGAMVSSLAERLDLTRAPRVLRSTDVSMPVVFGAIRPSLIVSDDLDTAAPGAEAVLAHELAHIRRHDFLVQLAARVTLALLWWHPGAWVACRSLVTSAEEACDDWAIALTGERRPYADSLLQWAETISAAGGLACQFRGRNLIRRVQRTLMAKGVPTVHLSRGLKVAIAVCAVLVIGTVSAVRLQTARAQDDPEAPVAEPGPELTIYEAAEAGDIAAVEAHLDDGADINAQDKWGMSPLHWAVKTGQRVMVEFLLDSGADLDLSERSIGWTPLEGAAWRGYTDVVELMLTRGGHWSLEVAAGVGNVEKTKELLAGGADPAEAEVGSTPPLHFAANTDHTEVARLLLEAGAAVDATTHDGRTPLSWAVFRGHTNVAGLLIERGADLHAADDRGRLPIHQAVEHGHADVVALLLDAGARYPNGGADINALDEEGHAPLHNAAISGQREMVELLLDIGADIALPCGEHGWAPLGQAVMNMHADVAELMLTRGGRWSIEIAAGLGNVEKATELLADGANPDEAELGLVTPLRFAAVTGHANVAELLLEAGAEVDAATRPPGLTALFCAAWKGRADVVELLLEAGAAVDATCPLGRTPLHQAARAGHADVVALLLKGGADLQAADDQGKAPIHYAAWAGQRDMVALLLGEGMDVDAADDNGWTPLHWAVEGDHLEVARLLIERGADVNAADQNGGTPLLCATGAEAAKWPKTGRADLVALLLDNGADVNATGNNGAAPIHMPARLGHVDVVALLLDAGADLTLAGRDGKTALHLATQKDYGVAQVLLDHGAAVDVRDNSGATPMDMAAYYSYWGIDLCEVLADHGAEWTLSAAAGVGDQGLMQELLDAGADVNEATGAWGQTALGCAALTGDVDVVEMLLANGAEVGLQMGYSAETALHCAAGREQTDVMALLLEEGADIDALDRREASSLYHAVEAGHVAAVELLLVKGADVRIVTAKGRTALQLATEVGHEDIADLIARYGDE